MVAVPQLETLHIPGWRIVGLHHSPQPEVPVVVGQPVPRLRSSSFVPPQRRCQFEHQLSHRAMGVEAQFANRRLPMKAPRCLC